MIPKLSKEQICVIYDQGFEAVYQLIETLQNAIQLLEERVTILESRIAKDSHNSSKPPSSDIVKKESRSLRKKSGRRSGGQPGHQGTTLKRIANPDHIIKHPCKGSCECSRSLEKAKRIGVHKRQVIDIKPVVMETTEHQAEIKKCACGRIHTAPFPADVISSVQYGKGINSLAVYLIVYQLLPLKRTQELLLDLLGVHLSEGTLKNMCAAAHNNLKATDDAIKGQIMASAVAHVDETGFYVMGKRWWLHATSTLRYTYYFCHPRRGREGIKAGGILTEFKGRLIHDFWRIYFRFGGEHGLCNVHHLRELIFIHEEVKAAWAAKMKTLLLKIKERVDRAKAKNRRSLHCVTLRKYRLQYEAIIRAGYRAEPAKAVKRREGQRGRIKQSPSRNLLDRFEKYDNEVLAFMDDFSVPFSNNLVEQDIRMMKVKQKISGCFRSELGAHIFCRIRSYISTVKKQEYNVFAQLEKIFMVRNPNVNLLAE